MRGVSIHPWSLIEVCCLGCYKENWRDQRWVPNILLFHLLKWAFGKAWSQLYTAISYMYAELFELRFRHDRFEIFVYIVYTYTDQNTLGYSLLCLFFIRKVGITFS